MPRGQASVERRAKAYARWARRLAARAEAPWASEAGAPRVLALRAVAELYRTLAEARRARERAERRLAAEPAEDLQTILATLRAPRPP